MQSDKEMIDVFLEDIIPNRFQPRLTFDEKKLQELADSIKQHGIIQPIVVRKVSDKYEIIAGERRYKAALLAGLTKIPAIVIAVDDNLSAEMAVAENTQREDLNAIERATSFKKLLDRGYLTQDQLATKLGVTQATISNTLRLLTLTPEIQNALLNKKISERHARSLLMLKNPIDQNDILNRIINQKLTVKQSDDLIKGMVLQTKNNIAPADEFVPILDSPDIQTSIPVPPNQDVLSETNLSPSFLNEEENISFSLPNKEGVVDILEGDNQESSNFEQLKDQSLDINPSKKGIDINKLLNINNDISDSNQNINNDVFDFNQNANANLQTASDEAPSNRFFSSFDDEETNMSTEENVSTLPSQQINSDLPDNESTFNAAINEQINLPKPSPKETNLDSLLNEYSQQPTFVQPEPTPNLGPSLDLKGAIGRVRDTVSNLEKNGLIVDVEEFDFENLYQIIIKINK